MLVSVGHSCGTCEWVSDTDVPEWFLLHMAFLLQRKVPFSDVKER
jgi:hypothetical protein